MEDVHLDSVNDEKRKGDVKEESDFETAIIAAGFGKFNILLLIMILACSFSQVFEANNMSYVLPIAQCDLNLSLDDKGKLNSISFAGMVASGFFWGFLSDNFGRKKIMFYGYLFHLASMLAAALSQTFIMLMTAKFFGGLIVNGPTSAMLSLLTELHRSKYRAKIQLTRGMMVSMAHILLPLLSWGIFPADLDFNFFEAIDIHSWNVFLLVCSLPPIISWSLLYFMPESPKFLMNRGRNEEALKVFQKIYRINTGKSEDTFPVKSLIHQKPLSDDVNDDKNIFNRFIIVMKPLFHRPYVFKLILACTNAFMVMMSANTLKFWQPQLLQAVNDYESLNDGSSSDMCDMLEVLVPKNVTQASECYVNLDNSSVYKHSLIIISATQLAIIFLAGTLVDKLGKKLLLATGCLIAAACSTSIYFIQNSETLIALFAVFSASSQTALIVSVAVTLELFPTSFRNTALALHMVTARSGAVVGNMVFPVLLQAGCLPPFLFIGLTILGSACLAGLFSNTEGKALK